MQKNNLSVFVFILFSLVLSHASNAQQQAICGFDVVRKYQETIHPELVQKAKETEILIQQKQKEIIQRNLQYSTANIISGGLTEIPVVVHVISKGGVIGSSDNPSDASILAMITHLNDVYAGTSGNIGSSIPIRFALAKRMPTGCGATNGIIRIDASSVSGYSSDGLSYPDGTNAPGATETAIKNLSSWPINQYLNVWIVWKINANGLPANSFIAGYAQMPYYSAPSQNVYDELYHLFYQDGIVLNANQINGTSSTLPHEAGHTLGLYHTFQGGDASTCPPTGANAGDYVADTDPVKNLLGVSPFPPDTDPNPCNNNAPYNGAQRNIMGYGSIANWFTTGQSTRAQATFEAVQIELRTSLGSVAPPSSQVKPGTPPVGLTNITNFNMGPCNISLNELQYTSNGNTTYDGSRYYIDNTCNIGTNLDPTKSYTLSVTTETNQQWSKAWIDFNNNGVFDATEQVLNHQGLSVPETHTGTITPTQLLGAVKNTYLRMRVTADWSGATEPTPTGQLAYGQAEDFWVMISAAPPMTFSNVSATIANKTLTVNWATQQEMYSDRFEIEASKDGTNFTKIGEVKSMANDNNIKDLSYSFNAPVSDVSKLLGISMMVLLLSAGFSYRKQKRFTKLFVMFGFICFIALFAASSCKKNNVPKQDTGYNIRVKQISKDGSFIYSNTVQSVKSN
jgi:hypothetical protein